MWGAPRSLSTCFPRSLASLPVAASSALGVSEFPQIGCLSVAASPPLAASDVPQLVVVCCLLSAPRSPSAVSPRSLLSVPLATSSSSPLSVPCDLPDCRQRAYPIRCCVSLAARSPLAVSELPQLVVVRPLRPVPRSPSASSPSPHLLVPGDELPARCRRAPPARRCVSIAASSLPAVSELPRLCM